MGTFVLSILAPAGAIFLTSAATAVASPQAEKSNGGRFLHFLNGPDLAILSFLQYFIISLTLSHTESILKLSLMIPIAALLCLIIALVDKRWRNQDYLTSLQGGPKSVGRKHVILNNALGLFPLLGVTTLIFLGSNK